MKVTCLDMKAPYQELKKELDEEKCRIIRQAAEETFAEMGIGEMK